MDEEEKNQEQEQESESQATNNAEQKQELLNVSTIIANLEQKMSAKFSELEAKLAVYAHLAQAMDDIKLGRVQNADEAFDEILGELENLDI